MTSPIYGSVGITEQLLAGGEPLPDTFAPSAADPCLFDGLSSAHCLYDWSEVQRISQRGVSLLEVLIAVLVLAIGVLGAASLQLNAVRYSASAAHTTHASFIAYDLLDRMRANADELAAYAGSVSGACEQDAAAPATIIALDRADFARAVTCQLPSGEASIRVAADTATITISWSEARIVAGQADTEFVVSSIVRKAP
ncbi:type IV pilus modification protein PilV [Pseudomonas sp. gcc21]|uniref:type IV pilus modification protein PilV n=1 Tax=Pseudomonas sp. gcc21 TaxID=2726989 RepID=UPI001452627B|nr:type IV pilus modification protein PilV [Pseudomonas sp. gcc21]QJD60324.1 type IV pilus modification protein PilV [Pseudomonas sp. gcc21]